MDGSTQGFSASKACRARVSLQKKLLERSILCTLQVPKTIFIEKAIPKSATGKVQRRNIAQQYADADATAARKGRERPARQSHGELLALVQQAWQDVLGSPPRDDQHNFFSQGATSMDAIAFAGKLGNSTGRLHPACW